MGIKKNFIYNALLTSSNILFPLLTFPYLTRIIGAEGLGICNFILSYCENYIIIAALGLPVYGIREIARLGDDKIKRSILFYQLFTIHLLCASFLLIIYITTVFLHEDFQNYKQLAYLGGLYILSTVFKIEWLFSGVKDFKYITIRSLLIRSLSVLSIFILVKEKQDFNIYFIITVATQLLTVIININYAKRYISRLQFNKWFQGIRSHIRSVLLLGVYMVVTNVYTTLPQTLLGFISTKVAVGYYYAADKIVRMIWSIFWALTVVMVPQLNTVIEEKGTREYVTLIEKALNVVISAGIPITFLVFVLASPIINLLASKDFQNSIFCLKLMSTIILFSALSLVFIVMILSVNKKDKEMVIIALISMSIGLSINLVFIPKYAERAAAFAQVMAETIGLIVSFILAKKCLDFKFPFKLFISNLLFVVLLYPIILIILKYIDTLILQLAFSLITFSVFFVVFHFFILRNELFISIFRQYLVKIRNLIYKNR
jgi:O-antigen/teichoic acid export membrane protein